MPSAAHETLVELLRRHPSWLDGLLSTLGQPPPPPGLRAVDPSARVIDPATVQVDLLLAQDDPAQWLVVEVERDDDVEKGRRWLLATALLHDRYGVMGDVLVITHARSVARWAAAVASVSGPLGTSLSLRPRVVCLSSATAEALLASGRPELAFFAAWAVHAQKGAAAARVVERALRATSAMPDASLRALLVRAIINMISGPLRARLRERLMDFSKIPEGPLMRDLREAIERAYEARHAARWIAEGRVEGTIVGEAKALLRVLARRGIAVDDATRARVAACDEPATLDAWIDRAVTARSLRDVFDED